MMVKSIGDTLKILEVTKTKKKMYSESIEQFVLEELIRVRKSLIGRPFRAGRD